MEVTNIAMQLALELSDSFFFFFFMQERQYRSAKIHYIKYRIFKYTVF